jgi:hypothetical protein
VIGIEGKRFDAGEGLSPEVERAAVRLADELAVRSLNTALESS